MDRNRLTDIENKLMVTKGGRAWGRGELGVCDYQIHIIICKKDNQQNPTVYHKKLYSISCVTYKENKYEKEYIYMYNWITLLYTRN